MANAAALPNRLVLADLVPGARIRDAALVLMGAGVTGLAAQVSLHTPLSPVPFTLQTLAVLVVGASLGTVRGTLSIALYAAAGLLRVPWFADHQHGYVGANFGYILGFIAAAFVTGALAGAAPDRHVVSTVGLVAFGTIIVYVVGTVWLARNLHIDAAEAFKLGVRPFLATDAIKVGLAALAFPAAWKLVRRDR